MHVWFQVKALLFPLVGVVAAQDWKEACILLAIGLLKTRVVGVRLLSNSPRRMSRNEPSNLSIAPMMGQKL